MDVYMYLCMYVCMLYVHTYIGPARAEEKPHPDNDTASGPLRATDVAAGGHQAAAASMVTDGGEED